MTAVELVDRLLRGGYPLEVRHGRLCVYTAEGESLPEELAEAIEEHEDVIVAALREIDMRRNEWASLDKLAAEAVRREEQRHRRWLEKQLERDLAADFSRWLRDEAADLHARLGHEGETSMHAGCARSLLSRWSERWANARKAYDKSAGLGGGTTDGMDA